MATSPMSKVIRHLRRAMLLRDGAGMTDEQLLTGFVAHRDDTTFEAIVRRHGPMVLAVCRRVLRNHHDAEDAFQVTFLVLVRKAAAIASRELLANWLYGVAYHTALKSKATISKRRAREKQVTATPESEETQRDLWDDLQPLLDQELSRLPDKYRVPIVLCDLQGKTRKEAARQLGCPEGTVAGRLARARRMLAKRLTQRGAVISGGLLAVVVAQNAASACLPISLVSSTVKAASWFAAGRAVAEGVISAKVAALTKGVLSTMLLSKLKSTTAILLVMAVVSVGAGIGMSALSARGPDQKPSVHNQPSKAAAAEGTKQTAKQGHIFLFRQHDPNPNLPSVGENEPHIAMVSPDSKEVTWLTKNLRSEVQPNHPSPVAVSPDGRLIAYVVWPNKVFVKAVDNQKPGESLGVRGGYWCWSPDSRSLVVTAVEGTSVSNQIIDLETKGRKSLNLPKLKVTDNVELPMGHLITDCSRDGKWFLTTLMASKLTNWMTNSELYLVKWDGSDAKKIGQGFGGKLSPDGKTVLCLDLAWKDEVLFTHLVLVDVKSGERRRISRETNGTLVGGYCWSPDGKKIAYVWQRNPADGEKEYEFFLMVMDADGQNSTVVLSQKTSDRYVPFGSPDWR